MSKFTFHKTLFIPGLTLILLLFLPSWTLIRKDLPVEITGMWKTKKIKVTVRTEPKWMKFEFTSDSAVLSIKINPDKSASGFIGLAKFNNGKVSKNWGLPPSVTGVAYIVKCGSIGKIFAKDPVDSKEVEIWLGPVKGNLMSAELRFTENGAVFPMAGGDFIKEK